MFHIFLPCPRDCFEISHVLFWPPANAGDLGLIPGSGRSLGEGNGYPLQYSGLENSMDSIVHEVTKSDTTEPLSLFRLTNKAKF